MPCNWLLNDCHADGEKDLLIESAFAAYKSMSAAAWSSDHCSTSRTLSVGSPRPDACLTSQIERAPCSHIGTSAAEPPVSTMRRATDHAASEQFLSRSPFAKPQEHFSGRIHGATVFVRSVQL